MTEQAKEKTDWLLKELIEKSQQIERTRFLCHSLANTLAFLNNYIYMKRNL